MTLNTIDELEVISALTRARIIEYSHRTNTPHLGSCLSCVDILVALYFGILNIDPKDHRNPKRDRFVLSKGHGVPALFQVLAQRGFFSYQDILNSSHDGKGIFGEHPPTPDHLAGIEAATGSLGHGLPMAVGMMLANSISQIDCKAYVLVGDGECNEGSIWEAAMFASAQKLGNLVVIVDFNKWQATGRSCDVMSLKPLKEKWTAVGWNVHEIYGHDMKLLIDTLQQHDYDSEKPLAIIAHTVKGKGVSFMEDDNNWHYRIPNEAEVRAAKLELKVAT